MGVLIPQIASAAEDRASGAQVIEKSLITQGSVNGSPFYMSRTPGSAGNRRTFTWSCWFKRTGQMSTDERFLSVDADSSNQSAIKFINNTEIQFFDRQSGSFTLNFYSIAQYRDPGAWYHMVVAVDTTQSTSTDRVHIYMNGEEIAYDPSYDDYPTQNLETRYNNTTQHNLFAGENYTDQVLYAYVSQIYWIDGQQLDPTYFGFTDPLTGSWRPKTFNIQDTPTGSWGTCGYYLPMDGSAPIGEDQSGQGNHWKTNNGGRGGSGSLDIATGAFPILNTTRGGNVSIPGVRGQVGVAVSVYDDGGGDKFYLDGVKTASINVIPGQRLTFDTSDSTVSGHPFRLTGVSNGAHNAMYGVSFDGSNDKLSLSDNADFNFGSGDFTIEAWVKGDDTTQQSYTTIISQWQGGGTRSWMIRWSSDDIEREAWSFFYSTDGTNYGQSGNPGGTIAGAPLDDQKWHHIAVARSGGTIRCYTDGILNGTKTTTDTFNDGSADIVIGSDQNSNFYDGIISDLRVTKGEALYTGSGFTPPSAPMTTTSQGATASNVKLLCCNGSGVTDSTVTPGTITNSGSTASNENPYDTYPYGTVTQISEGSAGAATTITIPHNAPTDLYYYCTAHSGMGGSATIGIGTADENIADPYAWKNIYSSSFARDKKNNALTANVNPSDVGDPAIQTTHGINQFYTSNLYLDGNDALNLGVINGTDLEMGGYDWCIEFWVNSDTTLDDGYWNPILSMPWHGNSNNYSQIWIGFAGGASGSYTTGELHCRLNAMVSGSLTKTELDTDNTKVYDDKMWHHVAVTKEHTTARIYLDGELRDEASIGKAMNPDLQSLNGWIGAYANHDNTSGTTINAYMTGYLSDFRIYKGIAKYTQDRFIPASTEPTIVSDSPSGVSYGSELDKPTSGSVHFDSVSDHLEIADHADLDVAGDDHCVECWVYPEVAAQSNYGCIVSKGAAYQLYYKEDVDGIAFFVEAAPDGSSYIVNQANISANMSKKQWYHVAATRESNTWRVFVNGKVKWSGTASGTVRDVSTALSIGTYAAGTSYELGGFVSNFRLVKGSAVYTKDFTPPKRPLTNITNTKVLCCQSNSSAVSYAVSPGTITASGNATVSTYSPFDIGNDFVQGKGSGYCVLNSVDQKSGTIRETIKYYAGAEANVSGTLAMPRNSGKYYYEVTDIDGSAGVVGIGGESCSNITALAGMRKIYGYSPNGQKYTGSTGSSYGETWTTGDTISVLFDTDTRQLSFWKNGVSQGLAITADDGYDYYPQVHCNNMDLEFNFGQFPFKHIPPDGYKLINVANLPSPGVTRPDKVVGITTWIGNETAGRQIECGFNPDLVIVKVRNDTGNWYWTDTVRGSNKFVYSNSNGVQVTTSNLVNVDDNNVKGYKLGSSGLVNGTSSYHYVGYAFKGGGSRNTFNVDGVGYASFAASGTPAGDTTPTGTSINTKAGFSIIRFTPTSASGTATVPHGLGRKPGFICTKSLTENSYNWDVYQTYATPDGANRLILNNNNAPDSYDPYSNTAVTNDVFTFNNGFYADATEDIICYCWADVPGLQKFGRYYGNGSADGPFVNLGFRPAIIWYKDMTAGGYWNIRDNKRTPINGTAQELYTATNEAENHHNNRDIDFLSNGFKIRNSHDAINNSSRVYVYMCWAEDPEVNLYGGQSNAR